MRQPKHTGASRIESLNIEPLSPVLPLTELEHLGQKYKMKF